jgi:hypothetical protein
MRYGSIMVVMPMTAFQLEESMLPILLAAAVALTSPTYLPTRGIDAPYPNAWGRVLYMPTPSTVSADIAHRTRLAALRTEALDLQARDGGTLSPEHHALLQDKLNRIQFRFAEMRRRADLLSVDSTGRSRYSARTRPPVVFPPNFR